MVLLAAGLARALGQAPDSVAGFVYRDDTTSLVPPTVPYEYYTSLELHSDGTYVTRARIYGSMIWGTATYYSLNSGSFAYAKQGANMASITLDPNTANAETLQLAFNSGLGGVVTRGSNGVTDGGNFYLSPPATGATFSMVNISTLVNVRQGFPMTVGFVVTGAQLGEFLVRAVGPSLSAFGVSAPAPNPVYSLNEQSAQLFTMPGEIELPPLSGMGAGWSIDPIQAATMEAENSRAGAFPLTLGSNDKADIFLLYPGAYTITVNPTSGNSEGAVLVEVYQVY